MLGTTAMVVVLSVFNGFTDLFKSMLSQFDPDIKITYREGKFFDSGQIDTQKIKNLPGIIHYAEIIEEQAMVKFRNQQLTATIKGVPDNFSEYTGIDKMIVDGSFALTKNNIPYAVAGSGIYYNLGIGLSGMEPIQLFTIKNGKTFSTDPASLVSTESILLSGIFTNLDEIDSKYIIVPIAFSRDLFGIHDKISAIEIGVNEGISVSKIQKQLKSISGNDFDVKNRIQQHEVIYKTTSSEKWASYFILLFIILIASFNLLGSISMLILDKKTDIESLRSMGASPVLIRRIFLFEGWLITFWGAVSGILVGLLLCWVQIKFGIIQFPGTATSFVIRSYPVKVVFSDILLVFFVVSVIGFLVPLYPSKYLTDKN